MGGSSAGVSDGSMGGGSARPQLDSGRAGDEKLGVASELGQSDLMVDSTGFMVSRAEAKSLFEVRHGQQVGAARIAPVNERAQETRFDHWTVVLAQSAGWTFGHRPPIGVSGEWLAMLEPNWLESGCGFGRRLPGGRAAPVPMAGADFRGRQDWP